MILLKRGQVIKNLNERAKLAKRAKRAKLASIIRRHQKRVTRVTRANTIRQHLVQEQALAITAMFMILYQTKAKI